MTREQFISNVKATQKSLRRFMVALCCGDTALADDVAQETYVKAYLACGTVRDADRFAAWIFRIGYTTFLNHRRSEKVSVDYDAAADIAASERADAPFEYQELYMALKRLPDKERFSILLFYMQGYAIKEIAEISETSQDAIKQHLSRGRRHLRMMLTPSQK